MGLLASTSRLAVVACVGCYEPVVRDCTVTCTQGDDCAGDQVCSGGFCVTSSTITCNATSVAVDAAPPTSVVTIEIAGHGQVRLDHIATCDSAPPQHGHCAIVVPLASSITARAEPSDGWAFDTWLTSTCPDERDDVCEFVSATATGVGAKFRKGD